MRRASVRLLWLVAAGVGCDPATEPSPGARHAGALIAGDPVVGSRLGTVRVSAEVECSGALLTSRWLLTASHCLSSEADADPGQVAVWYGGTRSAPEQTAVATEVVRSNPALDLALVRLASYVDVIGSQPVYRRTVYPRSSLGLIGRDVLCVGWGIVDPKVGLPDQPAQVTFSIASSSGPLLRLSQSASGQRLAAGDAGGGCFYGWETNDYSAAGLAAIMVGVDGSGAGVAVDLTRPDVRSWLEGTLFGRASDVVADAAATPAVALDGQGEIDLFWVDPSGQISHAPLSRPASVESLGSPAGDPFARDRPAAVYLGANRHVVARSTSGAVYWQMQVPPAAPADWVQLVSPGMVNSGIGVASWQPDRMAVFARTAGQTGLHGNYVAGQWTGFEDIHGTLAVGVTAVMWDSDRLDAFTNTSDGRIWHAFGTFEAWYSGWMNEITGTIASEAAVVSWATYNLELFARNAEGRLAHYSAGDGGWVDAWTDTGLDIPSTPVAVIAGGQLHVFARNNDGTLWHAYWPR